MNLQISGNAITTILLNKMLIFINVRIRGVFIGKGSVLRSKQIKIDTGTRINGKISIEGRGSVSLGKYCAIGDGVRIISSNHGLNVISIQLALQKKLTGSYLLMHDKIDVKVGHDVWIGDAVIILPGVSIGNGVVIGAGSVVTRSIEPYVIVAGNPARKIGRRFPAEVAKAINLLKWWDWNEQELKKAAFLFERSLSESDTEEVLKLIDQASQRVLV